MCDLQCYIFPVIKPQNAHEDTRSADLKRHLSTHTGKKQFHCEICEYTTMEKSKLVNPMYTHIGKKPFPCEICDYATVRKSDLKILMRIHNKWKLFQ